MLMVERWYRNQPGFKIYTSHHPLLLWVWAPHTLSLAQSSLTLGWSIDTDPLEVLHAKLEQMKKQKPNSAVLP